MYKIELHMHTKYSSVCGELTARELAEGYRAAGYSAVAVTDHYNRETFAMKGVDLLATGDKLGPYLEGYDRMREEADRQGLVVYRGAELRFDGSQNDYLLFHYPDELLAEPERIFTMTLAEFIPLSRAAGAVLIQAHPFRKKCAPADLALLDGVEVSNRHPGHVNRNELALALAGQDPRLLQTGGSDCHEACHIGRGGILSETLPADDEALAALLRSRAYAPIWGAEREEH